MSRNKVIAIVIIVFGLVLVAAAVYTLLEPPKDGGILAVVGQIIAFLLGASANIKGWKDLFKKESTSVSKSAVTGTAQRSQEAIDSPNAEQVMRGKGGRMTQKSKNSPGSKQTME